MVQKYHFYSLSHLFSLFMIALGDQHGRAVESCMAEKLLIISQFSAKIR